MNDHLQYDIPQTDTSFRDFKRVAHPSKRPVQRARMGAHMPKKPRNRNGKRYYNPEKQFRV